MLRLCAQREIPFVARGAGTGLSGGALPVAGGIVVSLARMNRVLEIDLDSQRVVVEPGVTNLEVTRAVEADGFYYAPDPSSQQVCTIGGNVAENSGGAHCLKYGFTVNHVLGLELVLPDGEVVELGARADGPDLLGVVVGSEGTLGIATKVTVRVLREPEGVQTLLAGFHSTDEAGAAVSGIDRRRDPAGGDRDDGRAHHRGGRGGGRARVPARSRRRAARRARRRRRPGRGGHGRGRATSASPAARSTSAWPPTRRSARSSGAAARPRSPRWAGWRRLLRAGRRRAAHAAARGAAPDRGAR